MGGIILTAGAARAWKTPSGACTADPGCRPVGSWHPSLRVGECLVFFTSLRRGMGGSVCTVRRRVPGRRRRSCPAGLDGPGCRPAACPVPSLRVGELLGVFTSPTQRDGWVQPNCRAPRAWKTPSIMSSLSSSRSWPVTCGRPRAIPRRRGPPDRTAPGRNSQLLPDRAQDAQAAPGRPSLGVGEALVWAWA